MNDRYIRLFSTEKNLYITTSPVLICAGVLLKDNETKKLMAQIKFRSISSKEIKSILLELTLFDSADRVIGSKIQYTYLDLQLKRDEETGQKEPVFIQDVNTRAFSIAVKEVVFHDKTIWSADGTEWKSLGDPKTLIEYLNDSELAEQYSIDCQNKALCVPKKVDDIWICSCGKINSIYEKECHNCLLDYDTLIENLNTEGLRDNFIKRKYSEGIELMKQGMNMNSYDYLNKAIACFEKTDDWGDSAEKIADCNSKIVEIKANIEAEKIKRTKKIKKYSVIVTATTVFLIVISVILNTFIIPEHKYKQAEEFALNRNYGKAITTYRAIYDYKDSKKKVLDITSNVISAGSFHTVGLRSDGTVIATGLNDYGQCNVGDWKDIVAISADSCYTVGLKSDGTVVATGDNKYGQCNVKEWTDIIAISANSDCTVGLKSDGTVVATRDKERYNTQEWTDIIEISTSFLHAVGLKADGTVIATGYNEQGQCNVDDWKDIVGILVKSYNTIGLKSNGTVVATAFNTHGERDISYWTNIIDISSERYHTVGLKSDSTVVAAGYNGDGECDVDDWKDIVGISAGACHTIGLKVDGTIVATGHNLYRQCNVSGWDLF